jgi:4-amino-4-deoxy-L-arabinose transferase-like glycosyltransferase
MMTSLAGPDSRRTREILAILALILVGAVLRIWWLPRLGLIHFDEGIYALAGLWVFSSGGLAGIDPAVIPYSPPGFPVLVGLSYLALGVGDLAAMMVSIVSGTLTIPVAAWVSRRTFGPGAGGAAAAFAALSGPHVSFSRMALADASFLLFWLVAIGQGQRFLERPKPARAVMLGLAVGFTQLFKYNGSISGLIVVSTAILWFCVHPNASRQRAMMATWGWGVFAAIIAAVVYWPWLRFVDAHGGYSALLAHQRGYLGGPASWTLHLSQHLCQARFLCGGPIWVASGGVIAVLALIFIDGRQPGTGLELSRIIIAAICLTSLCLLPGWVILAWWIGYVAITRVKRATVATLMLGVGWAWIAILTPFYHPYARLWLPMEAFNWIFLAATLVWVRQRVEIADKRAFWTRRDPLVWFFAACTLGGGLLAMAPDSLWRRAHPRLLQPSDSLRRASRSVIDALPTNMNRLRILARPPLLYYLATAGRVELDRQPDLTHLVRPDSAQSWAVLDTALMRQENVADADVKRALTAWRVAASIPSTLNLPTLLDIDPGVARGGAVDMSAPIWLLRARPMEHAR